METASTWAAIPPIYNHFASISCIIRIALGWYHALIKVWCLVHGACSRLWEHMSTHVLTEGLWPYLSKTQLKIHEHLILHSGRWPRPYPAFPETSVRQWDLFAQVWNNFMSAQSSNKRPTWSVPEQISRQSDAGCNMRWRSNMCMSKMQVQCREGADMASVRFWSTIETEKVADKSLDDYSNVIMAVSV